MVTERSYRLVCHQSGMRPSSLFDIPRLEKAPSARTEGIFSSLSGSSPQRARARALHLTVLSSTLKHNFD